MERDPITPETWERARKAQKELREMIERDLERARREREARLKYNEKIKRGEQ